LAAIASTMCGIGGGLFAVPILHFLLDVPLKLAASTSLVIVLVMTAVGTLAELAQPHSGLDWSVVLCLSVGAYFGARLGQFAQQRIDARTLTWVFALALSAAGVRILLGDAPAPAADGVALQLDFAHSLGVTALGFGGGFVAPLLGVGGGLIVVPGLVLGLPGFGYLGARACSTAMSAITAAQLTWTNLRAGRLRRDLLFSFCAVAAAGAVLGILLVHRPGFAEAARRMLGALLVVFGLKFTWRALRAPR
jgi:uncharacterized membrane protein YfcA